MKLVLKRANVNLELFLTFVDIFRINGPPIMSLRVFQSNSMAAIWEHEAAHQQPKGWAKYQQIQQHQMGLSTAPFFNWPVKLFKASSPCMMTRKGSTYPASHSQPAASQTHALPETTIAHHHLEHQIPTEKEHHHSNRNGITPCTQSTSFQPAPSRTASIFPSAPPACAAHLHYKKHSEPPCGDLPPPIPLPFSPLPPLLLLPNSSFFPLFFFLPIASLYFPVACRTSLSPLLFFPVSTAEAPSPQPSSILPLYLPSIGQQVTSWRANHPLLHSNHSVPLGGRPRQPAQVSPFGFFPFILFHEDASSFFLFFLRFLSPCIPLSLCTSSSLSCYHPPSSLSTSVPVA